MLRSALEQTLRRVLRAEVAAVASTGLPEPLQEILKGAGLGGGKDALDKSQFEITSLNDLHVGAQAELVDACAGRTEGRRIRNQARTRRLHAWRGFVDRFPDAKKGEVSAALAAFETKEINRLEKLAAATEKWRTGLASKDPNEAKKPKPFYQKWLSGPNPEAAVKKLMAEQMQFEGELMTKLQKLGVDLETDVNPLLKGFASALDLAKIDKAAAAKTNAPDTVYVLDFKGDMKASAVVAMKQEISALLMLPVDRRPTEVVLRLMSGGGAAHSYGLAEAELRRLTKAGIKLTICIDEVAASGGYMMACVGDNVVCSPWAIIGSIGVITGMPNFSDWMDTKGLKFYKQTAGKNKNTLDPFTKPTDAGLEHRQKNMDRMLEVFRTHVADHRKGKLTKDIIEIAQGDTWMGGDALELGLVDSLKTSEDYIFDRMHTDGAEAFHLKKKSPKKMPWDSSSSEGASAEVGAMAGGDANGVAAQLLMADSAVHTGSTPVL